MKYTGLALASLSLLPSALALPTVETRDCKAPSVNDDTLSLIKEFEGFVASPEPDPVGLPTVGYGHLCQSKNCGEVDYDFPLSKSSATKLLKKDIKTYEAGVADSLKSSVKLNANQYGALVSWCFNVGAGAVESSSLVERLNDGESAKKVIANELPKWNKGGGQTLPGLTRRRKAEVKLAEESTDDAGLPAKC